MSKPVGKTAAPRKAAATKAGTRKQAATDATPVESSRPAKNILTAGIKALTNAHEEAVARQSRVFESLLGLGPKREPTAPSEMAHATTLDPFGFKKFEDVFDQRVARAMQHLGVPTAQAFADLSAEVERLRARVATLEGQARKR